MRFLLEFAACCGCALPRTSDPTTSDSSSSSRYEEERRSFVVPQPMPQLSWRPRYRQKQRMAGWKPTLLPICEHQDDVVSQRCDSIRSERKGKRSNTAKALLNMHDFDFRRRGGSDIITAFYPVPCMF